MGANINYTFIDLFAGIGGIRLAFEKNGCKCVFSSEFDPLPAKIYASNFGEEPFGDITKIDPTSIPDHDILLAGFPCQPFSIIGKLQGFVDTRGSLFFHIENILEQKKPYCFLLENVKNLKSHDKGRTLETIIKKLQEQGYYVHWKVLNALNFGLPQKRERTIIVGFRENIKFNFPKPINIMPSLSDILEPEDKIDPKTYASEFIQKKRLEKIKIEPFYPSVWHENKSGNISILPYSCALRHSASYNYLLVNGKRRFTPRELLRLQGFPDNFKADVSNIQVRQVAGNSVPVPLISAVAKEMMKAINERIIIKEKECHQSEFEFERCQVKFG